jgi:hypothetical protein
MLAASSRAGVIFGAEYLYKFSGWLSEACAHFDQLGARFAQAEK